MVKTLKKREPWLGNIQTSQTEPRGSISIAGFVRPVMLYFLLGYVKKNEKILDINQDPITVLNEALRNSDEKIVEKYQNSIKFYKYVTNKN